VWIARSKGGKVAHAVVAGACVERLFMLRRKGAQRTVSAGTADLYGSLSDQYIDRLSVPVIFFQGAEDKIVPPNQTELMVEGLKNRRIPVGYFLFDGEQHGFRTGENIKRALDAELYFYAALILRSGLYF
jgi:dipeptidyl aminopeptidase/acylaminoacyl peptidase